jgi:AhpD family alkylhydroperoxidase
MTERLDYYKASPAGMRALAGIYDHVLKSGLPKALVDLAFLRASQINGCAYCIDMHSRDLLKEGVAVEKLVLVRCGGRPARCSTTPSARPSRGRRR